MKISDYVNEEQKKLENGKRVNMNGNSLAKEIMLTFSNKKSLFSSKKIERFIVFIVFLILSVIYIIRKIDSLTSMELIEIIGLWLAYGGYNTYNLHKDKKLDTQNEES